MIAASFNNVDLLMLLAIFVLLVFLIFQRQIERQQEAEAR